VWAIVGTEVFDLLTRIAGWTPRRYEAWLTDMLTTLLTDDTHRSEEASS
jgi:hypothetical protein